jgi:hypothetical protein
MSYDGGVVGSVTVDVSRPFVDKDGKPCILFRFNFPFGDTSKIDDESALLRPFRKILRDGEPMGKIVYSFHEENNRQYILGSFVNTEKRLIFFPGVKIRKITRAPDGTNPSQNGIIQNLDHLSLERNWRTWHCTLLQKETRGDKYNKMNTKKIDDSLFLWFVMGIKTPDVLEQTPNVQEIKIKGFTMNDMNRRLKTILKSRSGSVFPITKVDAPITTPYYINFEVFIRLKQGRQFDPPTKRYDVLHLTRERIENRIAIKSRLTPMYIGGFNGTIWIRTTKLMGELSDDCLFISGHEYTN